MTKQTLDCSGPWRLRGEDPAGTGRNFVLEAGVPGHVHTALRAAGLVPDPFWRDQAAASRWIEDYRWTYERRFGFPPDFPRQWTVLQFDGLDTACSVRLNGREIGRPANMFRPHWYEVGEFIAKGENRLEVEFPPLHETLAESPDGQRRLRRMGCTLLEDCAPRFAGPGIWQDVRLVAYDRARFDRCAMRTLRLAEDGAELALDLRVESRTQEPLVAEIEIFGPNQRRLVHRVADLTGRTLEAIFIIDEAELWWPSGHGAQPLYSAAVRLLGQGAQVLDRRSLCFGIRTVAFEPAGGEVPAGLVVNGRPIFAQGANWLPADPWPERVLPSQYDRLLELARRGGVNCLRAWGGGIYEPEAFWDACDRLGILVLQDFMLAGRAYPEDEAFLAELRREALDAVPRLMGHTSLAAWSAGGAGERAAREALAPVCAQIDPQRPFVFPGADPAPPQRQTPGHGQQKEGWPAPLSGGLTLDYRVPGAPSLASLLEFMTPADAVELEASLWRFHARSSASGGRNDFEELAAIAARVYGEQPDPNLRLAAMEYVQCEWVRMACETARRRTFDCSGLLFWTYNDCWPAISSSLVDAYGRPKAGYYGMKRGFRPVIAALEPREDAVRIWVCSHVSGVEAAVRATFQPWTGGAAWTQEISVTADAAAPVHALDVARSGLTPQGVLAAEVTWEGGFDRTIYYAGPPRSMALPSALLEVHAVQRPGGEGAVTIQTNVYARGVTLEGAAEFEDNYFDMLPGEMRTIGWRPLTPQFAGPPRVRAWNGGAV